jgi:PAS domain S-box-containing protein
VTIDSDSARFSQALRSAIFWPLGVFFAATILLVVFIVALLSEVTWSTHSYEVLAHVRHCENLLINAQNNVRGYLLTGDQSFVTTYQTDRLQAENGLKDLKVLVSDNQEQTHNAQDIVNAMRSWGEHADILVAQRAQAPVNPDWMKLGATLSEQAQRSFEQFVTEEEQLRDTRLHRVRRMKTIIAASGGVLALLLVVTIVYQVRRQMLELAASYRDALKTIEQRQAALARSENDLEAQKEWLRVTLTSIGDGVIVTDPEGRVVLMNHESEWLTGWTLAEALHHPLPEVFKIVNEDTRAVVENPVTKVLIEKKTIGLANHTVLLSRKGDEWPIEDSAAPILDANGETLGVVLVFHDASSSRLAQRSLKASNEELEKTVADRTLTLQQAVSDLQAFSYSVSHDLRSPLRAMQGFAEAVLEDYGDKLDERGRDYLGRIKAAGTRLDRLILDLLSYTRIARDDAPMESSDLDKIVRDVIAADSRLQSPAAEIRVDGPLPKVLGRESALNQVVTNLLGNAVKFVHEGKTPSIRIWSEERAPSVRLWIEDKGLGIAKEEQEKIFNMFTQLNDSAKFGGTGVGLAIVKKAMEIMHGKVGVESTDDSGSRFWLELPKAC